MKKSLLYQRGSLSFFLILLVVVVFAVMLAGGGSSLFSGDVPSPEVLTPTPTIPTTPTVPAPTPTIDPSKWTITAILGQCQAGPPPFKTGELKVTGPLDGYVQLEIEEGTGFKSLMQKRYTQPDGSYPLHFSNDQQLHTKNWKISVYAGGSFANETTWTNGIFIKSFNGAPTGCASSTPISNSTNFSNPPPISDEIR